MPERPRYPTEREFWRRLEVREVEPDLRESLAARTRREEAPVGRAASEALITAVAARLVPGAVPARALAAFLDAAFDRQLGRGDEREGLLPRDRLIPAGFAALEREARRVHHRSFTEVPVAAQDELLARAEKGDLPGHEGFESGYWFKRVLQLLLLAYGSDPRGMVQMGFPGPSYRPGHIWLDEREVAARARRKRGYLEL